MVQRSNTRTIGIQQQARIILAKCNSMPFGAAWAYYGKVLVLANAALLNGRVRSEVK